MRNDYDVIVIGSGIGGLVCANYLIDKGLKVLMIEKNKQAGGYCTSFARRGFKFDTAIHALQDCGEGSLLNRIFAELDIKDLHFVRTNPTDTIISRNRRIDVMNDVDWTINNFKSAFPNQKKNLDDFFGWLLEKSFLSVYLKFRKTTFADVLRHYITDDELRSVFSIFLGNIGSLPENTSAVSAYALLKQFILNGGYYPRGGMQSIPDSLVGRFTEKGGNLLLNTKVREIIVRNSAVCGVVTEKNEEISAEKIVSNSDMTNTIKNMLDPNDCNLTGFEEMDKRLPSLSIYIVYLTLNKCLKDVTDLAPGVWYIMDHDGDSKILNAKARDLFIHHGLFCSIASKLDPSLSPPGCDYVRIMTNTKDHDQRHWRHLGSCFSEGLIDLVETIIPGLRSSITCKGRATSVTMKNYTMNRGGSVSGWLNSPQQINSPVTDFLPRIKGLFFAGHWVTDRYGNGGVAMAADSGKKTAKLVLKKF